MEFQQIAKANKKELKEFYCNGVAISADSLLASFSKLDINALCLLTLENSNDLCKLLKSSFLNLSECINSPSYKEFAIKKKQGGKRIIYSPNYKLKKVQKQLNYFLQAYYLKIKPAEVHGFVIHPKSDITYCNIVENAKPHVGKKQVLNIDLKDFFPNITAKQIKAVFTSSIFNFNDQIATALALLCTFNKQLPIGAPTSPVLSNFVCLDFDADLKAFCTANDLTYTRYADDLTFSSNNSITEEINKAIAELIEKHKFKVNKKKLRLKQNFRKQTVTGITVNQKVNVDRVFYKKVRATIHSLTLNGIEQATLKHFNKTQIEDSHKTKFMNRLGGYINFIGQVKGTDNPTFIALQSIYKLEETNLKLINISNQLNTINQ